MAYNATIRDYCKSFLSAGDISNAQYTFFKRSTNDTVVQSTAGDAAVGVLWTTASAAGRAVTLVCGSEPNVYVGTGGVTVGAEVASDANGKAVAATSGDVVVGIARETVAAGGLVRIDFLGEGQYTKA